MFSVGRKPAQPYASFAAARRLDGVRIGVIREYMSKKLFAKADEESIDIVERAHCGSAQARRDARRSGSGGRVVSGLHRALCAAAFEQRACRGSIGTCFPLTSRRRISSTSLLEMRFDPAQVPAGLSLRSLNSPGVAGEGKYRWTSICASAATPTSRPTPI